MLPIPLELSLREAEVFFLVLTRTMTLFMLVPLFGYTTNPTPVKIVLAVTVSIVLIPFAGAGYVARGTGIPAFIEMVFREFLVGLTMGMFTLLLFTGIQYAGELVGMQIGFSIVNLIDPTQETNLSIIGQFNFFFAMMLFLLMNGHHRWIEALDYSYQIIPPGTAHFALGQALPYWLKMVTGIFTIALKVGGPAMAAMFLTDTALGLLSRSAEQLNIFTVGFSVKILVGLFAITTSLGAFAVVFGDVFDSTMKTLEMIMKTMAP